MKSYTCLGARRSRPVDFLNSFGEQVPISPLATFEQKKRHKTDHKETGHSLPPTHETEVEDLLIVPQKEAELMAYEY